MKRIILFFLFFIFSFSIKAQKLTFPPYTLPDRSNVVVIGLKGGSVMPHFTYTDSALKGLGHELLIRPIGGLFVDIPVKKWLITPQVSYYGGGMHSSYHYKNNYIVDYLVRSNYLDIRLLAAYRIRLLTPFFAYAFLGSGMGILLSGDLSLNQHGLDIPEVFMEMSNANMKEINAYVVGGLGVQYYINMPTFSLSFKMGIGYNVGYLNSFSEKEIAESATPSNVYAYNNTGKRYLRGWEVLFGMGLPLKFDKLSCGNFGKNKRK